LHPGDKKWDAKDTKDFFWKNGPKLHYDQKNSEVAIFRWFVSTCPQNMGESENILLSSLTCRQSPLVGDHEAN
jgi:hypothetical protein